MFVYLFGCVCLFVCLLVEGIVVPTYCYNIIFEHRLCFVLENRRNRIPQRVWGCQKHALNYWFRSLMMITFILITSRFYFSLSFVHSYGAILYIIIIVIIISCGDYAVQRSEDPSNDASLQHPQMAQGAFRVLLGVHLSRGSRRLDSLGFSWQGTWFRGWCRLMGCLQKRNGTKRLPRTVLRGRTQIR